MENKPQFICITELERHTTFALVADGKYASMQFSNNDVPDPIGGVWSVARGAQAEHMFVRTAKWDETVRVDGAMFDQELMGRLQALLATAAKAA